MSAHDLAQRGEIRRAVGCGVVDPLLKSIAEGLRARGVDGEFDLYEPEGGRDPGPCRPIRTRCAATSNRSRR